MSLNNLQKDVIGYLRGVIHVLALWNIPKPSYPLDAGLAQVLREHSLQFEELLAMVERFSLPDTAEMHTEMRSALDDILPSQGTYYDQMSESLLLSLYSGVPVLKQLDLSEPKQMESHTMPVFRRMLAQLVDSMLWGRLRCSTAGALDAKEAKDTVNRMLTVVSEVCPNHVGLASVESLYEDAVGLWKHSECVKNALTRARETDTDLARLVREL